MSFAQNETTKWYFGAYAGLDFITNPPTILTNGALTTSEGCSSISDAAGNLLFYTDGVTVYTQAHVAMGNGTGLLGFSSSSQSGIIVKQPGSSTIYYVFTQGAFMNGTRYSIVDMSMAAGQGSVTAKNVVIQSQTSEKLTSVRHCNGIDFWILTHDYSGNTYSAYQLTAAGLNTTAVTSAVGQTYAGADFVGILKLSPNGKKLADGLYGNGAMFQLSDFDNSTGIVSNPIQLGSSLSLAYGCEFSPDGSKLYGSRYANNSIYQWDLCAGSTTAIVGSQYSVVSSGNSKGALQLAIDGKIYIARSGQTDLAVIASPNLAGSSCNYTETGQSISPKTSTWGLPNFITSSIKPTPPPFTYTAGNNFGCYGASFTPPFTLQTFTTINCVSAGYSLTGMQWNFGDPGSGINNTSTLSNPIHGFTYMGTYTVALILNYSCGGGTDTIKQVVNITQPCISVSSTSITCANLGSATVQAAGGIGPYSYTWMPTAQANSVATGLSPGTYTLTVFDFGNNFTYTALTTFNSLIPLTGNINVSSSVTCNGAATGTGNITSLAGGSGATNYTWTNGSITYTVNNPSTLSAGLWTTQVADALTGCNFSQVSFITQPPPLSLVLSSNSPTACPNGSITLTGTNSGGTPFSSGSAYTYTWTAGPTSSTQVITRSLAGNYIYTLSSRDSYSCFTSTTIAVDFVPNPTLSVSNVSICPFETGILIANGASTYTWSSTTLSQTGSSFGASPLVNTQYTVVGSALSCTSSTTASILIKPNPNAFISSVSSRCSGDPLSITAYGGVSYLWSGPNSFTSAAQNATLNPVGVINTGLYQATVTAANSCTSSTSWSVTVYPTPTLSAAGSTVCSNQSLNLQASAISGSTYFWKGPSSYTSNLQNPGINFPSVGATGFYTVVVTNPGTCTNAAVAHASVVNPPNLSINLSSSTLCANAFNGSPTSITLTCSGANTYSLNTPFNITNSNPSGTLSVLSSGPPYLSGLITVSLQGSNGICSSYTQKTFTILSNPLVSLSNPNSGICKGDTYIYQAQGADTYVWGQPDPISTFTVSNSGRHITVHPNLTTVYSVYGNSLGCNSTTESSTLQINPIPTITLSPAQATLCLNNNLQLLAEGSGNKYLWSPSTALNQTTGSTVITTPISEQTYTVLTSLNNCTNSAVITVSVLPLPKPTIQLSKNQICLNEEVTFTGSGAEIYNWYGPDGSFYKANPLQFFVRSLLQSGTYSLAVSDANGCRASTITNITVLPLPNGILTGISQGCVPFNSDFIFSSSLSTIKTSWQLNNKTINASKFSYTFTQAGDYLINGYYQDTTTLCSNTSTYMVNAYALPKADFTFSPEKPIESDDMVYFTNTSKGEDQQNWNWYFLGQNEDPVKSQNTSYFFKDAGVYPVAMIVSDKYGCSDSIIKNIKVEIDFTFYVPNAFSPNGDNLNDEFKPVIRGIKFYELQIFNRWGALIFSSNDLERTWDGTFNGTPCKNDSYIWKITLTTNKSEQKKYTGNILLNR